MKTPIAPHRVRPVRAFSLVEVTIALGLVSYALLALLGLFTVALSSSRDSTLETALSQITLHAASTYDGTSATQTAYYSYDGVPVATNSTDKYFEMNLVARPSGTSIIPDTSSNLRLLTLSISSEKNPGVTNTVQTSVFVP